MERGEISEYMGKLADLAGNVEATVGCFDLEHGRAKPFGNAEMSLALVAATLMFCMELLKPDAMPPSYGDALMSIVTGSVHGYLGE